MGTGSGYIFSGVPRAMVAYGEGIRPSKEKTDKSFLPEGGLFINFVDRVLCVGTGLGGWIEYDLTQIKIVDEIPGS